MIFRMTNNDEFISSSDWQKKGFLIPVHNKNIFTIDTGGEHENCLVILHGYLTSSYDYRKVLPELCKHYRVIIQDLIGFGFSDKIENKYFTITEQTDYVLELWNILELRNFTLVSHDYGNLITKEILARKNSYSTKIEINKIYFSNGSAPINHHDYSEIHKPDEDDVSKEMISMLTSFGVYKKIMKESFYDENKITDEELKEMWTQLHYNNGRNIINFVYNYVRERKIFWDRWVNALKETEIPIELVWGREDKITDHCLPNLRDNKFANQNISWIENTAHFPMLESPEKWLQSILKA